MSRPRVVSRWMGFFQRFSLNSSAFGNLFDGRGVKIASRRSFAVRPDARKSFIDHKM